MDFLTTVLQTIAFAPTLVNEIEGLFSHRAGAEKKDAAVLFLQEALSMSGAAANRQIVDPEKFQGRNGKSHRRRGRVFECFHLGEGEVGTTTIALTLRIAAIRPLHSNSPASSLPRP